MLLNVGFVPAASLFALFLIISLTRGQLYYDNIRWCTVDSWEQRKCVDFNRSLAANGGGYNFGFDAFSVECHQGDGVEDCVRMVDEAGADLMSLEPGLVFSAGRYHNLVPIVQEQYSGGVDYYYAVAVVKKQSNIGSISQLRGVHACFPRVGDLAGWVLPITQLISQGMLNIADCNNHVRSVAEFFGTSCAVGSLTARYNPLGDNSNTLCELCGSRSPTARCTDTDPYAGHAGAIHCLTGGGGDIAFVKHSLIDELVQVRQLNRSTGSPSDTAEAAPAAPAVTDTLNWGQADVDVLDVSLLELLCVDGSRAPLNSHQSCHWGRVPSHALVVSASTSQRRRQRLQTLLQKAVEAFGSRSSSSGFSLFSSHRYGVRPNLMFQDATVSLKPVPADKQLYSDFLGRRTTETIGILSSCPVSRVTLCVTSLPELVKCILMKNVLKSRLLKPNLECVNYYSQLACMLEIYRGNADIAMMDAGDVYTAGLNMGLVPIMSETFELDQSHYYAVAVAKKLDLTTDLLYLKNKRTCHSAVMHGAGWVVPMAYLVANERIRGYSCDAVRAASQAFAKSCLPGVMLQYYRERGDWRNLCQLCHGSSQHYCARNAHEQFYGHTGAFRCLVEGGGDVAFVKHTTVAENTGGQRKQFWARNQLQDDYQLLCRDGKRAEVDEYERCHIGRVRSNALVTRRGGVGGSGGGGGGGNTTHIDTIVNLFLHAQQYFGRKHGRDHFNFRMFQSDEPHADLIFSDATHQLVPLPADQQHYRAYLGEEFLQARAVIDCTAGAVSSRLVSMTTVLLLLLATPAVTLLSG